MADPSSGLDETCESSYLDDSDCWDISENNYENAVADFKDGINKENVSSTLEKRNSLLEIIKSKVEKLKGFGYLKETEEFEEKICEIAPDTSLKLSKEVKNELLQMRAKINQILIQHDQNVKLQKEREREERRQDNEMKRQQREKILKEREDEKERKRKLQEEEKERKRKLQEEKILQEEKKNEIIEKQKEKFSSFFVKPQKMDCVKEIGFKVGPFSALQNLTCSYETIEESHKVCMSDMRCDEIYRVIMNQMPESHYFQQLYFCKQRKIFKHKLICSADSNALSIKFLQFHDNNRPSYYGTWSKRSMDITGRTPFGKDIQFNYEVDSDDEWESETGESVSQSDVEEDEDIDLPEDLEEFIVPHGYLSEDEKSITEEKIQTDNEENVFNDQSQYASIVENEGPSLKTKMTVQSIYENYNRKVKVLVPKIVGCYWNVCSEDWDALPNEIIQLEVQNLHLNRNMAESSDILDSSNNQDSSLIEFASPSKQQEIPDYALKLLANILHNSTLSKNIIVQHFLERLNAMSESSSLPIVKIPKTLVRLYIKKISSYQSRAYTIKPEYSYLLQIEKD